MERSTPAQQQPEAPAVVLNGLSIVLMARRIDTAHINPDFLRHNGIVDPGWQIAPPVIIESGLSLIQYSNGLSVTATNDDLVISQSGAPLASDEIVSPSVASRYLTMAPWSVEYSAVHTDLNGSMDVAGQGIERRFSPLHRLSSGMLFHDTAPNVQARVVYQFDDKSITMYITEIGDDISVGNVRFSTHIHRDIDGDLSTADRNDFIESVVGNWQSDVADFSNLAFQFYCTYSI